MKDNGGAIVNILMSFERGVPMMAWVILKFCLIIFDKMFMAK